MTSYLDNFFPGGVAFRSPFEAAVSFSVLPISGMDRLDTWMDYLSRTGQRYCPLAVEQIHPDSPDQDPAPGADENPEVDPDEEEDLPPAWAESSDGVPGEPADVEFAPTPIEVGEIIDSDELRAQEQPLEGADIDAGPCEDVANGLAEANERGEITLSADGVALVAAVLGGGDGEGIANLLAERDERGEISLTEEELSLVRCLLGEPEPEPVDELPLDVGEIDAGPCEDVANRLAEANERGEITLSADGVALVAAVLGGGDGEGIANLLAERDERGEISLTEAELSLVRCLLGEPGLEPGPVQYYGLRSIGIGGGVQPDYDSTSLADAQRAGEIWRDDGAAGVFVEHDFPPILATYLRDEGWSGFISVAAARELGWA